MQVKFEVLEKLYLVEGPINAKLDYFAEPDALFLSMRISC